VPSPATIPEFDTDAGEPAAGSSKTYAYYAVGVLMLSYMLSFVDRQILSILAEPIKRELHLADWQIGAMSGLAFAVLYTVVGIPVARVAERGDRPFIIATAIFVWSLFTFLGGFVQTFIQLVLIRVGVGVGEAGCTPPALSLISDTAPREKRSFFIGLYLAGSSCGSLLGMALGGLAADLWGWRGAFMAVGAPGILMAALAACTLREPRRSAPKPVRKQPATNQKFGEVLAMLWKIRTYRFVVAASSLVAFIAYGANSFLGSFFFRNHGAAVAEIATQWGLKSTGLLGIVLGTVLGVSGVVGSISGGWLASRHGGRDPAAQILIPGIALILSAPCYILALHLPSFWLSMALMIVPNILIPTYFGPAYAIIQGLVPPTSRATTTAIMLFIINMIGLGLGPVLIGLGSDMLSSKFGLDAGAAIKGSLSFFLLLAIPAGMLFLAARKTVRAELVS